LIDLDRSYSVLYQCRFLRHSVVNSLFVVAYVKEHRPDSDRQPMVMTDAALQC